MLGEITAHETAFSEDPHGSSGLSGLVTSLERDLALYWLPEAPALVKP